jgi:hypothetical protein
MNEAVHMRYKIMIHTRYSVVSADMIATLNNKPDTTCVANVMSGEEFLSDMQNDSFYISPYGDSNKITDPHFKSIQELFFKYLPHLKWIDEVNEKQSDIMNREWKFVKSNFNQSNN